LPETVSDVIKMAASHDDVIGRRTRRVSAAVENDDIGS